jgi:hypothetical protein
LNFFFTKWRNIHHQKITTPNAAKIFQVFFSKFGQIFFRKNKLKQNIPFFFFFLYFGETSQNKHLVHLLI